MKKICIVTICNGSNFGNRLQNYALQETLKCNVTDAEVVTARNISGEIGKKFLKSNVVFNLLYSRLFTHFVFKVINKAKIKKKMMFLQFNKKYINWTKKYIDKDYIPDNFENDFDYFVAGSDQIWNPYMPFNSSVEFLCFAPPEKRIAYAASFGVSELTEAQQEFVNEKLKGFTNISVREESGLKILEQAGIYQGRVVLDPTMLLTAEQWESIEIHPTFSLTESKYLLSYVLDENNTESKKYINELSQKRELEVIDITNLDKPEHYGIGPSEFVYLIHHAAYICTDSFHATVFSILFHKKFSVFGRWNMNGRISTLLNMVGVESSSEAGKYQIDDIDYKKVDKKLEQERIKSIEFIKEKLL